LIAALSCFTLQAWLLPGSHIGFQPLRNRQRAVLCLVFFAVIPQQGYQANQSLTAFG
jgi:hypothetical protein